MMLKIDDVVIVGIDETSFQAMDMQWPWPREVHGELVNEISKYNPKSIVFDVVFSEPSNEVSDNHFAEAISNAKGISCIKISFYEIFFRRCQRFR